MESTRLRILVAGGGIGGLTAAIALRQRGHHVDVVERAAELRPVGAGLTVQINAMKVFARLGLADAVIAAGQTGQRGAILNWDGSVISMIDVRHHTELYGLPSVAIHRAELQRVLLAALKESPPELGVGVEGFSQDAQGVTARLSDGTTRTADLLIGADGIHSAVRAQLHGDTPPEYAGYTCWRGVCPNDGMLPSDEGSETWGEGSRFGIVPIGPRTIYWFAVADAPPGGKDGPDVKRELLERFGNWHAAVGKVINATPAEAIFRMDINDRPVIHPWGQGRVTLLGDAAHPMTPNLGQGACMAIEDALVLSAALHEERDPAAALRVYEERRRERTDAVVNTARRLGQVGQWSNPVARAVRNTLMRATPDFVAERQVRWLYEFNA